MCGKCWMCKCAKVCPGVQKFTQVLAWKVCGTVEQLSSHTVCIAGTVNQLSSGTVNSCTCDFEKKNILCLVTPKIKKIEFQYSW